jgi:hypothetical protein
MSNSWFLSFRLLWGQTTQSLLLFSLAVIQCAMTTDKRFNLMKKFLALIALVCCVAPASANDNLLSSLGLAGMEKVSVQEAEEVAGRGFVYAFGTSESSASALEISGAGEMAAIQELELQGLNALEGLTGASSALSFDLSEAEGAEVYQIQGSLSVSAATVVAGAAN